MIPNRIKDILSLGLPIMGSMLSQSITTLADAIMIGKLGAVPLAAVGVGSSASFVIVAVFIGIGAAVQAMVARRKGEGRLAEIAVPLNGGLLISAIAAIILTLIGFLGAEQIISFLTQDPAVIKEGTDYLQARLVGLMAVGFSFSFRGYWNGINRSTVYLKVLVAVQIVNIAISYIMIFGHFGLPQLGVIGAGLGTSIAFTAGTIIYFWITAKYGKEHGFLHGVPKREEFILMNGLMLSASFQQLLFSSSILALFWIIGHISTAELAVAHVLINLSLILIFPAVGLGMAATSFVSEALGKKDPEDAYQWGWDIAKLTVWMLLILGIPLWLFPNLILSLFLQDPALIELGRLPLQIAGISLFLEALAIVFRQALMGAGVSHAVTQTNTLLQWGFLLPMAWLFGDYLGYGLLGIWLLQMIYRILSSGIFTLLWMRKKWIHTVI